MSAFVAELARGDVFLEPVRATGVGDPHSGDWIVGHVRLDGREALRDALGAAGVATQRTVGDLELVQLAWRAWRETCTERLRGDFCFALWDARERVLFCARDQLGVRPLYWAEVRGAFICSNELDSVRAHAGVTSRLHRPAIDSFLKVGYNDDLATTSFADIRRLPPAHQLTVRAAAGAIAPRRYWDFPVPEPLRLSRDEEYIERFRDILGEAVRDRLRANRAAIMLSGGLDSTSIAATARRVAPDVALHAWTYDMTPFAPDEEVALARGVASRLNIAIDVVRDELDPLAQLDSPRFRTPEPLDEPEWIPWIRLLRRIGSDAPVLIIGDDGDALFRPPGLLAMLRAWPGSDVFGRLLSYTISHRRHPHLGLRSGSAFRSTGHALRPEAVRLLSNPVWQSILEPAQRAYTGVELDIVWPLLDTRVIGFVFSVPPVPWCQKKELLRRSFNDELTDSIVSRPKTPLRGFYEGQVARWRSIPRSNSIVLSERVLEFVDSPRIAATLRSESIEGAAAAWRVLILDHWLRGDNQLRA